MCWKALTIGVTTCLAASIVFFPALLAWITRNRPVAASAAENEAASQLMNAATLIEPLAAAVIKPPVEAAIVEPAEISTPLIVAVKPVEIARSIEPAHVTEEEVAALLETAFTARSEVAVLDEELLARSDVPNVSIPRRRELPRRSDAA